jgi:hypothetical protein
LRGEARAGTRRDGRLQGREPRQACALVLDRRAEDGVRETEEDGGASRSAQEGAAVPIRLQGAGRSDERPARIAARRGREPALAFASPADAAAATAAAVASPRSARAGAGSAATRAASAADAAGAAPA